MNKVIGLLAGMSLVGWVGSLSANTITVDIADSSSLDITNIRYVGTEPSISTSELLPITSFPLAEGDSATVDLFKIMITTDWLSIGTFDVEASIDFLSPDIFSTTFSDSHRWYDGLFIVAGTYLDGILNWEPDAVLTTLSDGTLFSVELENISFRDSWDNNSFLVSGTFSNLGIASVPEPATTLLLGAGLLVIGLVQFRKKA